jgi:chaperonin cofactor prefoldin
VENDDDVEADEKHEDPVIKHIYGKLKKYQHLQQKMEATMNATTSGCNNIRSNTQHMLDEFQETMSNVHKTISTINTIKTGVELAKREVQTASDLVARLQ